MRVAVLASGGKDSAYATWWARLQGWDVVSLVTVLVKGDDSMMFQLQNTWITAFHASSSGIPWKPIAYKDNKDIIDLLEMPNTGVYATLDTACKTPSSTGKTFCAALHSTHAKSKVFAAPKLSSKKGAEETRSKDDHFVVKHFAGDGTRAWLHHLCPGHTAMAARAEDR